VQADARFTVEVRNDLGMSESPATNVTPPGTPILSPHPLRPGLLTLQGTPGRRYVLSYRNGTQDWVPWRYWLQVECETEEPTLVPAAINSIPEPVADVLWFRATLVP